MNTKRLTRIFGVLVLGTLLYLADCAVALIFNSHPEVPWFELGIFAGTPFALTIVCVIGGICYFLFAKDD